MNPDEPDDNTIQESAEGTVDEPQTEQTAPEADAITEETSPANEQSQPSGDSEGPEQPQDDNDNQTQPAPNEKDLVTWTAHEYIHTEKSGLWYLLFFVVTLGLIALSTFVFQSYTFSGLIVVMAVALFIYTRRPPRVMQYTLSGDQGIYVGEKLHHFNEFKAFGLIKDGEHHSIMLIPTKRFAPGLSVYFPEESGEKIVDILGVRLPMKPLKLDFIDLVVRQLRL